MVNNIIQYVYYYPPAIMLTLLQYITNIYYDTTSGLVDVTFTNVGITASDSWLNWETSFQQQNSALINYLYGLGIPVSTNPASYLSTANSLSTYLFGNQNIDIYLTPEAYTNWYTDNIASLQSAPDYPLFQTLYNQLILSNAESTTASKFSILGYNWITYAAYSASPTSYQGSLPNVVESAWSDSEYVLISLVEGSTPSTQTSTGLIPALGSDISGFINTTTFKLLLILGGMGAVIIMANRAMSK